LCARSREQREWFGSFFQGSWLLSSRAFVQELGADDFDERSMQGFSFAGVVFMPSVVAAVRDNDVEHSFEPHHGYALGVLDGRPLAHGFD